MGRRQANPRGFLISRIDLTPHQTTLYWKLSMSISIMFLARTLWQRVNLAEHKAEVPFISI